MKSTLYWLLIIFTGFVFCSQSAKAPYPKQTDSPAAQALIEEVYAYLDADQLDSAILLSRVAIDIAAKANDWSSWGKAHTAILEAYYYLGDHTKAIAEFNELEEKARPVIPADSSFWGIYYNIGGAVFDMVGNYEQALKYGLLEVAFYENLSRESLDFAVACNNVGTYYRSRGDYDRALAYTQAALQAFLSDPNVDPSDLAWTYGNMSKTWYRKVNFRKSRDYAEKALEVLEQNFPDGDHPDYVLIYNDLANSCTEIGEYEEALTYLQRALQIHEGQGEEQERDVTWHNLGHVYRMMGRFTEAKAYLSQSVERYGPKHRYYGKACRHLGYIAREEGDYRAALAWQQEALRALTDTFDYRNVLANPSAQRVNAYQDFLFTLRDKGRTLQLLAEEESDPKILEAALSSYDIATGLLDSMRAEYQEASRRFWNEAARPIMESAIEVAMELHQQTGEKRYLEKAFQFAEKSKALLLAEALRESTAKEKAGIPEDLLEQEKALKIDISFYKKQIFRQQQRKKPDKDRILLWQSEILDRHRAYERLLKKLESEYPEYFTIKYSQPEISLASVQERLPEQTGLIEYFVGDAGVFVFYFDRSTARGFHFSTDETFSNTLDQFLNVLRDRGQVMEHGRSVQAITAYADNASALFKVLLAPAIETMPTQLIVIPDGKLAYLPFELLLTDTASISEKPSYADLPYLIQQTTVRYEYSADLALKKPERRNPSRYFVGYAPTYTGRWSAVDSRGDKDKNCREADPADFAPLSKNQEEVAQIAKMLQGEAFLAEQATEQQFRQKVQEPRILHLAMHGFLNDCDPLYSGLVFTNQKAAIGRDSGATEADGFLHAYEIYNLRMNAELAVLSACNTGRGKLAKGEGVISLARAFKYAGCANVLMSLWQADDQATAQIMQGFYRYLREGLGKDAAIRAAKLEYLKSNNLNHPFFWGAFVLIGDEQPLQQSNYQMWYALAALLFVGMLGWFWYSRRKKAH